MRLLYQIFLSQRNITVILIQFTLNYTQQMKLLTLEKHNQTEFSHLKPLKEGNERIYGQDSIILYNLGIHVTFITCLE